MKKQKTVLSSNEILQERIQTLHRHREWKRVLLECVIIGVALYLLLTVVIGFSRVSGSAMEPALSEGETVLLYRLDLAYQADDLVLLKRPDGEKTILRVVAEPGDVVDITAEGVLLVNGSEEKERITTGQTQTQTQATDTGIVYPYTVPENSYYVLGDNREEAEDSRSFGSVEEKAIIGRVVFYFGVR